MRRIEWVCMGAVSAALLLGAGCQTAQGRTPEGARLPQATGGSGASERSDLGDAAGQPGQHMATYEIPSTQPDRPSLRLMLTFMPEDKTVSGTGSIHETTAPPLVPTELHGNVSRLKEGGPAHGRESTLVVASGHRPFHLPPHSGHGPVLPDNFELRMVLSPDGQTGEASYKYRPEQGAAWIEIKDAPVKRVDNP